MNTKNRRSFLTKLSALLATFGIGRASNRSIRAADAVSRSGSGPLFSSAVAHGGLLYLAGKGAHFEGDIKAHTDHVLNELEKELKKNGSSMEKVLKVNVYLHDLNDYKAMNEVYRGRFGDHPPVRTTVACSGGIPGNSLVEIDCIAAAG
ncbi:MAG: RidA family protein [Verrucomicrobia bacterium]|nr:RidA family protein [Verrucomicrobiota bacterium]